MFNIPKRCFRCLYKLRKDGTCQNPKCSRYVPDKTKDTPKASDTANTESK